MWLYQLSTEVWTPEKYRAGVWEGEYLEWKTSKITTGELPKKGDILIYWFVKTKNKEPGLYGWGIILEYDDSSENIRHRPVFPSDYLKMNPINDEKIVQIIDEVRGKVPRATMWLISKSNSNELREKIHSLLGYVK